MHPFMDKYENEAFWDTLAGRLARREINKNKENSSFEDFLKVREKHEIEFEENGIKRLMVDWSRK